MAMAAMRWSHRPPVWLGRRFVGGAARLRARRRRRTACGAPALDARAFKKINPAFSPRWKKELVGNFANAGREWQPMGTPTAVRVHDFPTDAQGKAIPYGVYDMARNEAWVSVGRDHDTPAFAVASIRHWWRRMGRRAYPDATALYITADAGGSNGYRCRAWKHELQHLADDTGLTIQVSHFPPGTKQVELRKIDGDAGCACMISRPTRRARRIRTASTTWPATKRGTTAATTTPLPSRSPRFELVAPDGPARLPRRHRAVHHRRCWREQRVSVPRLEARASTLGR